MFTETLKKVVDNVDGGIAAIIMGLDGIPVDQYIRVEDKIDITTIAMEFSFILGQVRKAAESLAVGETEELSIKAPKLTLVVRMLSPQYFIAVALTPGGNFGKCRYLMRLAGPNLSAQL